MISNDFMNCRMSTSLRLFGIPQRKKSAVTKIYGTIFSRENILCSAAIDAPADGALKPLFNILLSRLENNVRVRHGIGRSNYTYCLGNPRFEYSVRLERNLEAA